MTHIVVISMNSYCKWISRLSSYRWAAQTHCIRDTSSFLPCGEWAPGHPKQNTCLQLQRGKANYLPSYIKQNRMEVKKIRKDALDIFDAAVSSVYPPKMLKNAVTVSDNGNTLTIDGHKYRLHNNVYVVGFGKAVSGMANTLEEMIGKHIVKGIISVPLGSQSLFRSAGKSELCIQEGSKIEVYEGAANNLPDENAHKAALAIQNLVEKLGRDDLLIVLISGGGSALLPSPIPPVSLSDELDMTQVVSSSGGTIQELNVLRQNLETLKGGGLAAKARRATVVSLILSDVIDDKLDIISSGPTVPLRSSPRQCLQILERLKVKDKIPRIIVEKLNEKASEKISLQERPYQSSSPDSASKHVHNVIIGSNSLATQAAMRKAKEQGYMPIVLTNSMQGEARTVAAIFSELAKYTILTFGGQPPDKGQIILSATEIGLTKRGITKQQLKMVEEAAMKAYNSKSGICLICGGETTVNVKGTGKGGRNQEMALAFALNFSKAITEDKSGVLQNYHVEFLSAGTDGQDGPTDAAGAVVNRYLITEAVSAKLNPASYLENSDSYNLFKSLSNTPYLIQCGLTGTNVMDIQVMIVKLPS